MLQPYVSRPEAEDFLADLGRALEKPQSSPAVFHVWGIGGVGKSRLTQTVQEVYQGKAKFAAVSFGLTEGIDEPIPLMAKLYEQLVAKDAWNPDPFWDKYTLYFETIQQLQTQAANGRGEATPEQVGQVKQLLQFGMDVAGELFLSESAKKAATTLVDRGIDAVAAGLSLKDGVQQLLQQHKATRRNVELQEFMLAPLPHLTQAFAAGLNQQAQQQPIYEKVPTTIDTWLWRTLLGNTPLAKSGTRLIIAGRHYIRRTEGWRKLHQDRNIIFDRAIERFDLSQTQDYLTQIGLTDVAQAEKIFQVTKGLPYYLNWVREQTERGQTPDFEQGNEEIVRLLLQGLNDTQKLLIQLAACCLWFDSKVIRYLAEQHHLDFATAADDKQNCFGWLTQLSFVEPTGNGWRLDDVARDIFRQSLEQDDLENIHTQLAQYFLVLSNQEIAPNSPTAEKYSNLDWLKLRVDYLYHLLFTRQSDLQTIVIAHLLEAHYFGLGVLVHAPLRSIMAEFDLSDHPLLRHNTRQFLQRLRPAVEYGWAVLQQDPIDYSYNEANLGLSKVAIDQAVEICLHNPSQFNGVAKLAALLYKSRRCPQQQKLSWLEQAQTQAEQLLTVETPTFLAELFLYELGNSFYKANHLEKAIAAYDQALAIKPDYHEALINKGNALSALGQYEAAIAAYDQALAIQPDYHEALNNKGNALYALGQYEAAIAACDQALAIQPDYQNAWYNRGLSLKSLKRYEEALASFDRYLEFDSQDAGAWRKKGQILMSLRRYQESVEAYDIAIGLAPEDDFPIYDKACCYGLQKDIENAIYYLQKAIDLDPKYRAMAKTDTDFDPIRHDERFRALVEGN